MLTFETARQGPAVLLIHGFPLGRAMWSPQLEALAAAGYRGIAPDLPGFGGCPPPVGEMSMRGYAEALVRLLDAQSIERAAVCGMSMGGDVLLSLLEQFPERVAAAGFIVTRAGADDAAARQKRRALAETALRQGAEPVAEAFSGVLFAPETANRDPELLERVRRWMLAASPEGLAAALAAMRERPDFSARLATLSTPSLVIGALEDRAIPVEQSRLLAAGLPDAEMVEIAAAGHMVNLEQPAAFNQALLDFLARRYPAGSR